MQQEIDGIFYYKVQAELLLSIFKEP